MTPEEQQALEKKAREAESHEDDEEDEEELSSNPKYIEKLKKDAQKWRLRAKENKDAAAKAMDAENRLKEAETKAQSALSEVQQMRALSERRIIDSELKALGAEFGLKKIEYVKLGESFEKLKVSETGDVIGAREMLIKLKASDPDLFRAATTTNTQFQQNTKTIDKPEKKVLNMSDSDYKQAEKEFLRNARR